MKQILKRGCLFFLVFFLLSLIIRTMLPNKPYWGNQEYLSKVEAYKKQENNRYNTVFFGSSRILTGLIPAVFDSLLNQSSPRNVRSFNLASSGTWFNETCYLYNKFLDDPQLHLNVNLVVMEFQNVMSIAWDKISSDKVTYYQDAKNLYFIADYSLHENDRLVKKTIKSLHFMGAYSFAYFENLLNVGKSDLFFPKAKMDTVENRGYRKLEFNSKLVSETEIKRYKENISSHLGERHKNYNTSFYKKLLDMISRSKQRGIKMIFILPPVKLTSGMMAVFNALPDSNKMEVCDTKQYSDLYMAKNWSDETHFNHDGAKRFTKYVVDKLIPLK